MAEIPMSLILDSVDVKNRVVDGKTCITQDGKQWEWAPGEVKRMPRVYAEWFVYLKSLYRFSPGEPENGIQARYDYKLAIIGDGKDESDITRADVAAVKELLDVTNMPELTRVDPQTGKPMRRVYIDPRSTGANDALARETERKAMKDVSSAIVHDAADKIADAAQGLSESDIAEGVRMLATDAAGPASA